MSLPPATGLTEEVRRQWEWASAFDNDAMYIVAECLFRRGLVLSQSTREDDVKNAIDGYISFSGWRASVAIRQRDWQRAKHYRDVTIRSFNCGAPTELHKFRNGHCDLMFYGWCDSGEFVDYVVVDLREMRSSGLLHQERELIHNSDMRTKFISYAIQEIEEAGALMLRHPSPIVFP